MNKSSDQITLASALAIFVVCALAVAALLCGYWLLFGFIPGP